ncbi:MAG: DUF4010 domain-containing protein [Tenacibaculum sp.]|nr:DUF4010 domain-containing protein [Tenacibaculum sp.]
MLDFLNSINPLLVNFILVVLFSFSIGMERRKQYEKEARRQIFGTDRTFTLIGILGFLLLMADTQTKIPYLIGMLIITIFIGIFYISKVFKEQNYGLTSVILCLITYGFPLFLHTTTLWLSLLLFVVVLILSDVKKTLQNISTKIQGDEFLTLAKFIIIIGIILPILPKENIHSFIPVSPYKIWLAIVVVSAISYISYLLQRYVFHKSGILLTAILGGLYSSTASTIILSKKSKNDDDNPKTYAGAILITIAMMYLRVFIFLIIFNTDMVRFTFPYFACLFLISLLVGILFYRANKIEHTKEDSENTLKDENPLEFKVSIIFAGLYVLFSIVTNFVLTHYGENGLSALSIIVGVTDITPFLLNLFQGHYNVGSSIIAIATFQALVSNNILKTIYSQILGGHKTKKEVLKAFSIVIIANILVIIALYILR